MLATVPDELKIRGFPAEVQQLVVIKPPPALQERFEARMKASDGRSLSSSMARLATTCALFFWLDCCPFIVVCGLQRNRPIPMYWDAIQDHWEELHTKLVVCVLEGKSPVKRENMVPYTRFQNRILSSSDTCLYSQRFLLTSLESRSIPRSLPNEQLWNLQWSRPSRSCLLSLKGSMQVLENKTDNDP